VAEYSIFTQRVESSTSKLPRWHLDCPVYEQIVDSKELAQEGMLLQGWLLNAEKEALSLVVLNGDSVIDVPLSRPRPDVILKVLERNPEEHELLYCGFSERIKLTDSNFTLGIIRNGRFTELLVGSIEGKFKILEGSDGWLFLDNDTNKSVEQYTGKLKLSRTAKSDWKQYFLSLDNFSSSMNIPVCVLVAPSKEMVYEEFYPYSFSDRAPIQTLKKLVPDSLNFVLPIEDFKTLQQRSFRVCDTHWTLHGARLAAQLVASKLSTKSINELDIFSDDVYQNRVVSGDLGSKLYPSRRHEEDSLTNFSYKRCVVFDNNIDNFGRIIVMSNEHAIIKGSLLIFGSSSSYTMFHFLCRLYTEVVFIHSAGNIDQKIIKVVNPDCICVQTNARFVIKAPKFDDSVLSYIERKRNESGLKPPFLANSIPEQCNPYIKHFLQMLN